MQAIKEDQTISTQTEKYCGLDDKNINPGKFAEQLKAKGVTLQQIIQTLFWLSGRTATDPKSIAESLIAFEPSNQKIIAEITKTGANTNPKTKKYIGQIFLHMQIMPRIVCHELNKGRFCLDDIFLVLEGMGFLDWEIKALFWIWIRDTKYMPNGQSR